MFTAAERIHQKLILQDASLQQLVKANICSFFLLLYRPYANRLSLLKWLIGKQIKEQTDVKASLDGAVKSILEELRKDPNQEKLQNIFLMLTAIPEQVETALQKIQKEICHTFTREIQVWHGSYKEKFQVFGLSQQSLYKINVLLNYGQSLDLWAHVML